MAAIGAGVLSASCGTTLPPPPPDAGRAPSERIDLAIRSNDGLEQRVELGDGRGWPSSAVLLVGSGAVGRRFAGIVLQHDVGGRAADLMAEGRALAAAGAVVLIPDWALGSDGWSSDSTELWRCAIEAVQRSFDLLSARADVDPERLAFLGVGFGASVGATLATTDPRIRALALVEPAGDSRTGSYSSALSPGDRLHDSQAHPPMLVQFGVVEHSSGEDFAVWDAAVGSAGDQVHWYESAHEPTAVEARASFLASYLALTPPGGRP
jgi:hypothetical protein